MRFTGCAAVHMVAKPRKRPTHLVWIAVFDKLNDRALKASEIFFHVRSAINRAKNFTNRMARLIVISGQAISRMSISSGDVGFGPARCVLTPRCFPPCGPLKFLPLRTYPSTLLGRARFFNFGPVIPQSGERLHRGNAHMRKEWFFASHRPAFRFSTRATKPRRGGLPKFLRMRYDFRNGSLEMPEGYAQYYSFDRRPAI